MNNAKFSSVVKNGAAYVSQHRPVIYTGVGIAGMFTMAGLVAYGTPKALRLIEEENNRPVYPQPDYNDSGWSPCGLKPLTLVRLTWRCYFPAAVVGVCSTILLISANKTYAKRNAALAAACTLSESIMRDYQSKVKETFGEKEQLVRDAIAKDKIMNKPVVAQDVVETGKGDTLCFEPISGRYFMSDANTLRGVENSLNKRMSTELSITLNDLYYELDLPSSCVGDDLGWELDNGLLSMNFSSQLTSEDKPCLCIAYEYPPTYVSFGF